MVPNIRKLRAVAGGGRRILGRYKAKMLRRLGWLQGDWKAGLSDELKFWAMALEDEGRRWKPELYQARMNPAGELQAELKCLINAPEGAVVRILDVGAGPLTTVGKRWEGRRIEIIAIDPLAEAYAQIMLRLGIHPPVKTLPGHGEMLVEQFGRDYFDLALANNALDHACDPLLAIEQMLAVTKPGSHVYLWHFANEGITERYRGLHQWNFDICHGDMIISDGRSNYSVAKRFESAAELRCESKYASGKPAVVAILKKLEK